ncbi:hypothetical protein ACFE04_016963 [Oxalis oulophora]
MFNLYLFFLGISLHLSRWPTTTHGFPPQDPIKCTQSGCTLSNSYGIWNDRKDCHVNNVTYPKNEEDLRVAIAYANKNKLKIKLVSKFSHTIPKLACPENRNSQNSLLISTANYDSNILIDAVNLEVTVDAGVGLRDLIDKVEAAGLSLVAAPLWEGVSVGGLISTGAHGSSWWGKGGAVHDHVIGLSVVVPASESQGFAKVVRIGASDPLLSAFKVSLGMLGAISKVTFSLEKAFKRSITYNFTNDDQIEDEFMDHAKKYEFGEITWYPSRSQAVYRYDHRVPLNTPGDGVFDFLGFQSNSVLISKTTRASEKALEKAKSVNGKCIMASTVVGYKKLIANGLKNNGLFFTGYPVVGHQGKMQSSGSCLYSSPARIDISCAWDPTIDGLFFYESTAIFPAGKFRDFLLDIKKLRDLNAQNFCGIDIYNGILFRFIKASDAYLGQSEDSVVIDFNYYRASEGLLPRLNEAVMEEIEQIAFFKYGARPHWAKNRKLAFIGVNEKYRNFNKFVEAKKKLDPQNLFSGEWSEQILSGSVGSDNSKSDGCALEGECICSEDSHCSPSNGYFCRPGLVYEEARVCRYSPSPSTSA